MKLSVCVCFFLIKMLQIKTNKNIRSVFFPMGEEIYRIGDSRVHTTQKAPESKRWAKVERQLKCIRWFIDCFSSIDFFVDHLNVQADKFV